MSNDILAAEPNPLTLRQKTTRGAMWVGGQAMVTRVVALGQQYILAWLLAPSDFGLIGLAYTVTAIVTLMASPGVDTVLVQRLRRFRHWATPAFWLGLTMGIVGSVVMLLLAPLAAWVYEQPKLIGLIAVSAIALPIQALQIVPKAQLQIELRFRAVVLLGLLGAVLTAVLTIIGAWLGLGPYSFVVPLPITACVVSAATWRMARSPIRFQLQLPRWKYLFRNSATVGTTNLLNTFFIQADNMALGLAGLPDATIGAYVFAYNIAVQPLRLISINVPVVLFPGLSHLTLEPEKQVSATLRAMRLMMLVTVPVCLLQILLTGPIFRLVFPPRWLDGVLPCQILTFGLMINSACWPAVSLLMAQGRFREQMWAAAGAAFVFVAMMATAILIWPGIVSVAIAVAAFHCLYSPLLHWLATYKYASFNSFARETAGPLAAGLAAVAPCVVLQMNLPANTIGDVAAIGGGGLMFCAVYLLMVYLFVRASVYDLIEQVAPLWNRWRGGHGMPAADAASRDSATA